MGQFELSHNVAAGSQVNKTEVHGIFMTESQKSHDSFLLYSIGQASHKGCLGSRGGVRDLVTKSKDCQSHIVTVAYKGLYVEHIG